VAGWQSQDQSLGASDQPGGDGDEAAAEGGDHGFAAAGAVALGDLPAAVTGGELVQPGGHARGEKPEGGELLDWQKEFNKQVNKIRYVIEQVIANFKTWRIMHTDYRRPLATFPETISAVVALHFYATA
jgi:hypothetical protein